MPSSFDSLHLEHVACVNLNLGMSLRSKQLTFGSTGKSVVERTDLTESIANGPVNSYCTAITPWCQGSMWANRHGKKRGTFKGSGGGGPTHGKFWSVLFSGRHPL